MLSKIKSIYKNSFVYKGIEKSINKRYRKQLTNDYFTILCPNCIGGVIYNRLGKRFDSPTVNLTINTSDFCDFLMHLDYYISQPLTDAGFNSHNVPCAVIKGRADIPDITINFIHYKTFDEGCKKWNERKKRINKDNLYVIMYDIDDLNEEDYNKVGYAGVDDLAKFESFKCNNKILLTRNKNNKKPYAHYIEPDYSGPYPLVYLTRNALGLNVFENKWDFVKFLNKK